MVVSSLAPVSAVGGRIQIVKRVSRDRILEVTDLLSLEGKRSKIGFTLVAFDENHRATAKVKHFVDVAEIKLVCWDILAGVFAEWIDHKGSPGSDGKLQARVLTIRKDTRYRQPFVFTIDNGLGEQISGGAVKMAEALESLTMLLSEFDARSLAQTILDYIRDWEIVNFRRRQEAQTTAYAPDRPDAPMPSAERRRIESPASAKTAPERSAARQRFVTALNAPTHALVDPQITLEMDEVANLEPAAESAPTPIVEPETETVAPVRRRGRRVASAG